MLNLPKQKINFRILKSISIKVFYTQSSRFQLIWLTLAEQNKPITMLPTFLKTFLMCPRENQCNENPEESSCTLKSKKYFFTCTTSAESTTTKNRKTALHQNSSAVVKYLKNLKDLILQIKRPKRKERKVDGQVYAEHIS